jgi:hypothetical protein
MTPGYNRKPSIEGLHVAQRAGDAARDEIATRIPPGERAPWLATLRHIRNLPDA